MSSAAFGQVSGATLSGTVTDPTGATVEGAQVSIKNTETGVIRSSPTNGSGFYSVPNLAPGRYEVTVANQGFATTIESNVQLEVAAQQVLNVTLKVGQSKQQVEVNSTVSAIQLSSSTLSAEVNSVTVRELPLNGRDWTQLATLEPGVTTVSTQASTNSATTNRGNRGYGNQLTDSGHSPYENDYRVNGISINDYTNGSPGSVIGVNLGVDAIQEFSVQTSNYGAEYGRASGAVITAVTKSGTNAFHGSAYGFLRSEKFDAKNYFDSASQSIPPFHRNQFGIAAGGPIVKDKTFIFGDYEGIFQNLSATFTNNVPSAAARNGTLCSIPGPTCQTTQITVSPAVQPYLGFWPSGNGALSANGDTQVYTKSGLLRLKENYATFRVDQHFSASDSLAGSWFYDHAPQTQPDALGNVLNQLLSSRQMFQIEETHVFSPSLVNNARIGFSRVLGVVNESVSALNPIASDSALGSIPGHNAAILSVPGLRSTASVNSPSLNHHVFNSFQFYDDAFLSKGKHSIRFGFAAEHMQYNHQVRQAYNGNFQFGSLQSFLQDTPTSVLLLDPTRAGEVGTRQTLFGMYLADDWRIRPHLTLNLGVRYEPTTLPVEAHDRFQTLATLTSPAITPVHTLWPNNQTLRNFAPRVGLAWDPFGDGKTAVRAGFGMYDALPINWIYTFSTGASAPFALPEKANNLQPGDFPIVQSTTIGPASGQVRYMQPNPKRSYSLTWNLNVQRELSPSWSATIGYVGSHSIHMPDTPDDVNYTLPTLQPFGYIWPACTVVGGNCVAGGGTKLNPNVGAIRPTFWTNSGSYHGLQAGVTKRLSYGLQLQGSYNWGKCIDTGDNANLSDPFTNSLGDYMYFDKRLSRGLCDFNIAQSFALSYIWNIPGPKNNEGALAKVIGGWQLGGILKAQSGSPFTVLIAGDPLGRNAGDTEVDFPDRIAGCNPITGHVTNYVNLNCFTVPTAPASAASLCSAGGFANADAAPAGRVNCANLFGNAGRNQLVGPHLVDLDFSLFKNIPIAKISDVFNVQFRAEFFNVLNHPNFSPPLDNSIIFNTDGSLVSSAGAIDSTATDPRQIQFGMRLVW